MVSKKIWSLILLGIGFGWGLYWLESRSRTEQDGLPKLQETEAADERLPDRSSLTKESNE